MRTRIGLSVGPREVRAVCVESGVVRWHGCASLESAVRIDDALRVLFAGAPRAVARARVSVALSPAWVQAKPLPGLPRVESRRVSNQLLGQNQQAFFLWKGGPSVLADIHTNSDGAAWGAAFDPAMLESLVRAMRTRRMTLGQIAPAVAALGWLVAEGSCCWSDGEGLFELRASHGELQNVQRVSSTAASDTAPLPENLRTVGEDAEQYLAAYAAAVAPRRLPLAWRPRPGAPRVRHSKWAARAAACVAVLGSVGFALVAPGIRAARYAAAWNAELTRSRAARAELARTQSDLRRVSETLERIETYTAGRGGITSALASLSGSLPDSTAILTIHMDSANGGFSAISPHVTDVLPALDDAEAIVAPRIMGAVTRDLIPGATVERAAFRFRRPRATRQPAR